VQTDTFDASDTEWCERPFVLEASELARIEEVANTVRGPYIYSVTWDGVRALSLMNLAKPHPRTTTRLASFARAS